VATIKDVARLAGVGVGTASRVISGKGPVSPETAAKVHAAIAELDFRPSHIARALSAKSLGTIGVFVPAFGGAYYAPILRVVDQELRKVDRHMVAANGCGHGGAREQAMEGIEFLIQRECDGILVVSYDITDEDLIAFQRKQPNIAVVNGNAHALGDACFSFDHYSGGRLAAQTLVEYGHRRIAVIGGPDHAPDNRERMAGFFDGLAGCGIGREAVISMEGDFSLPGGWNAAQQLLQRRTEFTALFVANDEMALSALSCLQHAGIRVPQDVSVVGYDDIDLSAFSAPRLSTVHVPLRELVLSSVNWLLDRCYGLKNPVAREFDVSITLRDSLAALDTPAS